MTATHRNLYVKLKTIGKEPATLNNFELGICQFMLRLKVCWQLVLTKIYKLDGCIFKASMVWLYTHFGWICLSVTIPTIRCILINKDPCKENVWQYNLQWFFLFQPLITETTSFNGKNSGSGCWCWVICFIPVLLSCIQWLSVLNNRRNTLSVLKNTMMPQIITFISITAIQHSRLVLLLRGFRRSEPSLLSLCSFGEAWISNLRKNKNKQGTNFVGGILIEWVLGFYSGMSSGLLLHWCFFQSIFFGCFVWQWHPLLKQYCMLALSEAMKPKRGLDDIIKITLFPHFPFLETCTTQWHWDGKHKIVSLPFIPLPKKYFLTLAIHPASQYI